MQHICFLVGDLNLSGGTERVSSFIANSLSEHGYKISFLGLTGSDSPFFNINAGIEITTIFKKTPSFKLNYIKTVVAIRKHVVDYEIDVLIDVDSMLSLFSIPALTFLSFKCRHITWEHFNFLNSNGRWLRKVARHCSAIFSDTVVTLTKKDQSYWEDRTFNRADIVAIPNPITKRLDSFCYQNESKNILSVGRLSYQKGFDRLIAAWSSIADEHSDWSLLIIGNGDNEKALKKQAVNLGLNKSVKFIEATKEIEHHYKQASFYCMSSRYEGFPMVLLEALGFCLPIVSFDCETGPSEVVDEENGILVENNNIEELAHGISKMIKEKHREDMAHKSYEYSKRYRKEKVLKLWIDTLESYN